MKLIEKILFCFLLLCCIGYFVIDFKYWSLILLVLSLIIFTLRIINYKKINYEISAKNYSPILKDNRYGKSLVIEIIIMVVIIVSLFLLKKYDIIRKEKFSEFDEIVVLFILPSLSIILYFKFSDLGDNYYLSGEGIINGSKLKHIVLWKDINSLIFDRENSKLILIRRDNIKIKLSIDKTFSKNNTDKIVKEIEDKINGAQQRV
jgi:hypothetical protein